MRTHIKEAPKSALPALCEGNSPVIGEFPATEGRWCGKKLPYDDAIMTSNWGPSQYDFVKMSYYQYGDSHYKDKTASRPFYLYHRNSLLRKTVLILRRDPRQRRIMVYYIMTIKLQQNSSTHADPAYHYKTPAVHMHKFRDMVIPEVILAKFDDQ